MPTDVAQYNRDRDVESSGDEADSPCFFFYCFFNQGGSDLIQRMTNFNPTQFELLWSNLFEHATRRYNVSKSKK